MEGTLFVLCEGKKIEVLLLPDAVWFLGASSEDAAVVACPRLSDFVEKGYEDRVAPACITFVGSGANRGGVSL